MPCRSLDFGTDNILSAILHELKVKVQESTLMEEVGPAFTRLFHQNANLLQLCLKSLCWHLLHCFLWLESHWFLYSLGAQCSWTPLRRTQWQTPYENLYDIKPDIHYLKTFGCKAWVFVPQEQRKDKLSSHSEMMTFVGYQQGAKAYLFMNKDNKVVKNPHATFNETIFSRMTVKEHPHPNTNKDQSTNQNTQLSELYMDWNRPHSPGTRKLIKVYLNLVLVAKSPIQVSIGTNPKE